MIKFTVKLLPKSISMFNWNAAYNRMAEDYAKYHTVKIGNSKCEEHPDFNNEVEVMATKEGFTTKKIKFCCENFSSKFTFDNKK